MSVDGGASAISGSGTVANPAFGITPANGNASTSQASISSFSSPTLEACDYGPSVLAQSNTVGISAFVGVTNYFKMIGQDHTTSAIDVWRVTGTADTTGARYAGVLTTPLRNISISSSWSI